MAWRGMAAHVAPNRQAQGVNSLATGKLMLGSHRCAGRKTSEQFWVLHTLTGVLFQHPTHCVQSLCLILDTIQRNTTASHTVHKHRHKEAAVASWLRAAALIHCSRYNGALLLW